jgi:hypothetical protein
VGLLPEKIKAFVWAAIYRGGGIVAAPAQVTDQINRPVKRNLPKFFANFN